MKTATTTVPAVRLDTAPLEAVLAEIATVPDESDGIALADAKREASFKLGVAINAIKELRKLSAE